MCLWILRWQSSRASMKLPSRFREAIIERKAVMDRPMKITILGASGFYGFDIFRRAFCDEKMRPVELRIWNRNPQTGEAISEMLHYVSQQTGIQIDFNLYSDRKDALRGTDYVLFASCVDYPRVRVQDMEICRRFNVFPLEGETMSPGGLMNTFRHLPLLLDAAHELEEVSPNAVIIPVVNPLARLCDGLHRYSKIRFIGHCDGMIHTRVDLATAMGREPGKVGMLAAGVNHLTFILKLWDTVTGEDLLPQIEPAMPHIRQLGPFGFRFSNMVYRLLGYYPSPGDNHIADQLPFVSQDMQESIPIPRLETVFPPQEDMLAGKVSNLYAAVEAGKRIKEPGILEAFLNPPRTEETGTWMEALHGRIPPYTFDGIDIPNDGCISNLPRGSIVEVPGVIDAGGAHGMAVGELPPMLASLCQRMLVTHELAVDACVHASREAALQSLAFEPTVRDLSILEGLLDALLDENEKYLPAELVAGLRKKDPCKRIEPVAPAADNPMRPDAPPAEVTPVLDIVAGRYWGGEVGNMADAN
jgi:alpha-galactosidase